VKNAAQGTRGGEELTTTENDALARRVSTAVKRHISEVTQIDIDELDDDVLLFPNLASDLGINAQDPAYKTNPNVSLDSLDLIDSLVSFEEAFGIQSGLAELQSLEITPEEIATPIRIAELILRRADPEQIEAGLRQEML
jgi:acyl carrier protein